MRVPSAKGITVGRAELTICDHVHKASQTHRNGPAMSNGVDSAVHMRASASERTEVLHEAKRLDVVRPRRQLPAHCLARCALPTSIRFPINFGSENEEYEEEQVKNRSRSWTCMTGEPCVTYSKPRQPSQPRNTRPQGCTPCTWCAVTEAWYTSRKPTMPALFCGDVVLQADRGLRGLCTSSQWRNDGRITERCSLGWCSHVKQTWLSSGCPRRRKRAKLC